MSELEKLLARLCPDGVVNEMLGNLVGMKAGKFIQATDISDIQNDISIYPCYSGNGIRGFVKNYNQEGSYVLIGRQGALCGNVKRVTGKFYATEHAVVVSAGESININWLFHLLEYMNLNQYASKSAQPGLTVGNIEKLSIPFPPLPIQKEIARILDTFITLQAELQARIVQYDFYRNQIIVTDSKQHATRQLSLREITSLITKGTTPKSFEKKGINFVKTESFINNQIDQDRLSFISNITHGNELKRSILKENDILFTIAGATIGKCVKVCKDILPANTNQALAIIRLKESINIKYVLFCLRSKIMSDYIQTSIKSSAQPNLNLKQMGDFTIPFPSAIEQERIVSFLNRFDTLVNDITSGLPAEIETRRKQYEYYRDKLLTFKGNPSRGKQV